MSWLQKGVTVASLEQLRKGFSWTSQEAEKYMRQRLWPDWQARQYSTQGLTLPLDRTLSQDGASMMERIPAQAWEETVFAGPYKSKDAEIFSELNKKIGKGVGNLAIPTPELEWMGQYLEDMTNEGYKAKNEPLGWPNLGHFEATMAKRYLAQMNRDGWSWDMAGVALACIYAAHDKHKTHGKVFDNDYEQTRNDLVDGVKQNLAGSDFPQLNTSSSEAYSWAMCAWVVVSDEDKVRDAGLVPEPPINAKDTYRINKIAAFHKYMARGYEKRLVSEDSFQNGHGIAGLFWHHVFNSSGSSSTPTLKRVLGLPREKAQAFWMIQKDDPVVAEVIKTATQEMKKKKGNTKSMYSNVVLKLTSLVGRGADEPVPVQNRIKM